jgi:hypothetical protein
VAINARDSMNAASLRRMTIPLLLRRRAMDKGRKVRVMAAATATANASKAFATAALIAPVGL